jgi:MYXO-CTERM domain-containing protein
VATATVAVTVGVTVSPAAATVAPRGTQVFTASGGSGTGWTWSFASNASGGTIAAATGAYTAGPTGGVTDVVRATDSLGNAGTAQVTVTPATTLSTGCGCAHGGPSLDSLAALAAVVLALGRRRRRA